ncbi:hypothetical protein [Sphingobium xenophagum]|uniref:hypothetical protein n=1 Tax=Sphingobium xenophagum TaxID=121428 RepID=UPI0002E9648A|nr:hypothetical protein [Sphingobium xenophagum]
MGRIDWIPIADMAERYQDGRELLFWANDEVVIAQWDRFLDGDDEWYSDWATREGMNLVGATHFAEINGPF